MYGFKCAHCGQIELAHLPDLEKHVQQDFRFVPDDEYAEGLHPFDVEELTTHQEGYRFHLVECPGFEYPKDLSIEDLTKRVSHFPKALHYLPDELVEKVERELEKPQEVDFGNHNQFGGAATYISFNPRTGRSTIAYGE